MLEKGADINNLIASDIMTENPKCISKNALAAEALGVMEVNHIYLLLMMKELILVLFIYTIYLKKGFYKWLLRKQKCHF